MNEMNVTQETFKIRLEKWTEIVEACTSSDLRASEWLRENNIPRSQYYYWLKRVRKKALLDKKQKENSLIEIPFPISPPSESPTDKAFGSITLRYGEISLEIEEGASPSLLRMVLQEVCHVQ